MMWPVSWSCLVAAACLLQVLLPMGEPVIISSMVTSCFVGDAEDDSSPAPNEDAEDEPGDALPSALTPRRLGLRQFGPVLRSTPKFRVVPLAWLLVSQDHAAAS